MDISGDWRGWKISDVTDVLTPQAPDECTNRPHEKSEVGEIDDRPARQLRDPAIFSEDGQTYLLYTLCGEQGIAGAEVTLTP